MRRFFSPLCLLAVLLAAPLVQADPPAGEAADRLNKLERRVADLEEQMKGLTELKKLPGRLDEMDKGLMESFTRIRDEIKALGGNPPRVSRDLPDTATGNGQIQLVNSWDSPVLVVLDGTDYLLQPGKSRTITRRPGRFSYEVRRTDGRIIQAMKDSDCRAGGRPHMIEIYPQ